MSLPLPLPASDLRTLPGVRHAPDYTSEELAALAAVCSHEQFIWRGTHYIATTDARRYQRDGFDCVSFNACQANPAMGSGWELSDVMATRPAQLDSGILDLQAGFKGTADLLPDAYAEELSNDSQAATMGGRDRAKPLGDIATVRTIDLTPTWAGILPTLRLLLEAGNGEGKATAWTELEKMARLADERNQMAQSFAELADLLADWPTMRALSAEGAKVATARKQAACDIVGRYIRESGK